MMGNSKIFRKRFVFMFRKGWGDSWKLSALSHGEVSWKYARKGLDAKDNGNVTMRVADMKLDAAREYYRRKRG